MIYGSLSLAIFCPLLLPTTHLHPPRWYYFSFLICTNKALLLSISIPFNQGISVSINLSQHLQDQWIGRSLSCKIKRGKKWNVVENDYELIQGFFLLYLQYLGEGEETGVNTPTLSWESHSHWIFRKHVIDDIIRLILKTNLLSFREIWLLLKVYITN